MPASLKRQKSSTGAIWSLHPLYPPLAVALPGSRFALVYPTLITPVTLPAVEQSSMAEGDATGTSRYDCCWGARFDVLSLW